MGLNLFLWHISYDNIVVLDLLTAEVMLWRNYTTEQTYMI